MFATHCNHPWHNWHTHSSEITNNHLQLIVQSKSRNVVVLEIRQLYNIRKYECLKLKTVGCSLVTDKDRLYNIRKYECLKVKTVGCSLVTDKDGTILWSIPCNGISYELIILAHTSSNTCTTVWSCAPASIMIDLASSANSQIENRET